MASARLKEKYINDVLPKPQQTLGISNRMRVPRLVKIVVNMGMGVKDKDAFKAHTDQLAMITGQRPQVTKSRKSISNFKLREGMNIGAKVTMRGRRMYEFLDRLICAGLPRIRDFRGISRHAFDKRGNYTLGIREHTVFPEIDPNHAGPTQGMDITFVTTAENSKEALELLKLLGLPFAGK
jgi:large subunit ribosomal protein L5